jgi:hypothetical protein
MDDPLQLRPHGDRSVRVVVIATLATRFEPRVPAEPAMRLPRSGVARRCCRAVTRACDRGSSKVLELLNEELDGIVRELGIAPGERAAHIRALLRSSGVTRASRPS